MKQNIEFYPHYAMADQHAKFKMLRVQFGWEGEGKFWALNNKIALAENCCLEISKKYNKAAIANDLNFTIAEFDKFIDFLKNDCELVVEREDGSLTTDIIQETFAKVMNEREKARGRHRRTSGEKDETSGEEIHIVKESKGDDSKGDDSKGDDSKGDDKKKTNTIPPCPHQKIVDLWNEMMVPLGLAQVKRWGDDRKKHMVARWKSNEIHRDIEWWRELFVSIPKSQFLMGRIDPVQGQKRFYITLSWLVSSEEKFTRVMEGYYHRGDK